MTDWQIHTQFDSDPRRNGKRRLVRQWNADGSSDVVAANIRPEHAPMIAEAPAMLAALREFTKLAHAIEKGERFMAPLLVNRGYAESILARIDGTPTARPAGECEHCGRDNRGYESEPCSDDCPQYWEARGIEHPEHPTAPAPGATGEAAPDHWDNSDPEALEAWQYQVANGDTRLGYHAFRAEFRSEGGEG